MTEANSSDSRTRSILETTLKAMELLNATINAYRDEDNRVSLDIQTLERSLKEAKNKRLRIKENIATTKKSLVNLESVVHNLRVALSPVKRLPAEILLRIFQHVAWASILASEANLARWKCPAATGRDPLILSGVCTVWRSIMMTNASVWAPFIVKFNELDAAPSKHYSARLTRWMASCPPERQRLWLTDWTIDGQRRHSRLMGNLSVSWKAIDVACTEIPVGKWDIEKLRAREVTIYRIKHASIQYFVPLMRYANVLTIFGRPPEWETLPWVALKVLTIKPLASDNTPGPLAFNHDSFINLLQSATQLTDLTLDFTIEDRLLDAAELRSITHSKLESISFHLHHCSTNGCLFGVQLDAPSIRRANLLSLKRQNISTDASFYHKWDTPSHLVLPRLEDFELADTAELARWYPHVDTLEVEGPNINTLFFFIHTLFYHIPPQSEPLPFPRLRLLTITNTDLQGETLIELMENRLRHVQAQTPNVRPITRVTMYDSPGVTPSHWRKIQELLEEGRRSLEMRTSHNIEG